MAQHPSFDMKLRGRSELTLTRAASSGTRVELVQTKGPLQVIQLSSGHVAALVPPPRVNLVRFFGFFAPNASLRRHLVPKPPKQPPARGPPQHELYA